MKHRTLFALLLALVTAFSTTAVFAAGDFTDVPEDAYYAEAVDWAAEQEITTGRGGGLFAPDATVTRAEAVTFLWRMAGRPEPSGAETFADVESDPNNSWYRTAVQWAVEQEITNGTGGGNFSPTVTCSRGMILTMLYRLEGRPFDEAMAVELPEDSETWTLDEFSYGIVQALVESLRSEQAIADVKEGDYFELPVVWALFNDILAENQVDTEALAIHPEAACPRGEMVFFLHGAAAYEEALAGIGGDREPVETGDIAETVVLDQKGVKITAKGIAYSEDADEVWLDLTVENGSKQELAIDTRDLYVNTFYVSPSTFIPIAYESGISYDDVIVPAGESRDFNVGLNYLRDKCIDTIFEVELQMAAYVRTETEDGYENEEFAVGEPVSFKTSLYSEDVSYDPEGTVLYDEDGLRVAVIRAENNEYMGPQIFVYAYNSGKEDAAVELAEVKLDGETVDGACGLYVVAGKRSVESVWLDLDYENLPVVREAELTFRTMDMESWEPAVIFDPVTVPFAN